MSKRKKHSPEFKAKVALEALKGEQTVSEFQGVAQFASARFRSRSEHLHEEWANS